MNSSRLYYPCQASIIASSNDAILGYPHPLVGNTMVPKVKIAFKVREGEGANAVGERTIGAGSRLMAGSDDQVYYPLWGEKQADG